MSLFAMADRARESHHDDLASLWVIAATTKLDHVSAYQAYAAAKEEEARLLKCIDEANCWKAERSYGGDLAKVQFDAKLLMVQQQKESHDKDHAFRSYLRSKADKSLHEMIDTCDLLGPMFLAIWCNIKSYSSQHEVTSSMWKVASELFRSPDDIMAKYVVSSALEFDNIVKRLSSVAASCRIRDKNKPTRSLIWEKAATTVEYAVAKIKASILLLTVTDLKGQMETLKTSVTRMKNTVISDTSNLTERCYFPQILYFDSLLNSVIDVLPALIAHPDHSFPDFKLLLQEKCEQWRNDLERYVEIADAYTRCRLEGNEPSEGLLKDAKLLESEQNSQISLLSDYQRILARVKFTLEELKKGRNNKANEIELKKRDLYAQAVHAFVASLHSMHVHGEDQWFADQWKRRNFLDYWKFFGQIEQFNSDQSDIDRLIVDVSSQIISLSKHQKSGNTEHRVIRILTKARDALLASKLFSKQTAFEANFLKGREKRNPSEIIEMSKRYIEMTKQMLKIVEIKQNISPKDNNRDNELLLRLIAFFDLTVKSFLCIEEIADADYNKEQKAIPFRSKADKYFKAIEALSVGDVVKALAYEQEALNIEID